MAWSACVHGPSGPPKLTKAQRGADNRVCHGDILPAWRAQLAHFHLHGWPECRPRRFARPVFCGYPMRAPASAGRCSARRAKPRCVDKRVGVAGSQYAPRKWPTSKHRPGGLSYGSARRTCSNTAAGSERSTRITSMRPGPDGFQRWNMRSQGKPAKMLISGVPAAAATCCPAES